MIYHLLNVTDRSTHCICQNHFYTINWVLNGIKPCKYKSQINKRVKYLQQKSNVSRHIPIFPFFLIGKLLVWNIVVFSFLERPAVLLESPLLHFSSPEDVPLKHKSNDVTPNSNIVWRLTSLHCQKSGRGSISRQKRTGDRPRRILLDVDPGGRKNNII